MKTSKKWRKPLFRQPSRRPPAQPKVPTRPFASASPPALERLPGGAGRMGAAMRGAAAFWGRGQRPRPQNMPAAGLARQRAGGRSPPAAAPLRWVFHQRQKGNEKARPPDLWGLAHETMAGRSTATAPPLGQSRCPCPTGSGGLNPSAAGCRRRPPSPAVARISPSAQDRRPRRTGDQSIWLSFW